MAKSKAVELRNRCADLLAALAKTHNTSPEAVHPFSILMEIALDKENVSTSLRLEAARRACAFVAPTLGSVDYTSAGEKLEPGVRINHYELVQRLVHAGPADRLEMMRLLSAPEPASDEDAA